MDYICVKSRVLCPRCQSLVDSGEVDEREIDVMAKLVELEEREGMRVLKDATYRKSYFLGDLTIVVINFNRPQGVQVLSRLSRDLGEKLGTRVRVVEYSGDVKTVASQLLYPARILGVNMLWLPDGTRQHIVRVPRYDARRLPSSLETVEKALSSITGKPVRLRVE